MFGKHIALSTLAASALLLSACGGGSSGLSTRGAIAVSESTGKAALVWNAVDQNEANDAARSKCGGGDCQVVLQFSQCGAISGSATNAVYGVAEGVSAEAAQQAANESCQAKGGQSCSAQPNLTAQCN
ncbi:MAG: DUF4189 domain-containing protein [Hydrogenophaga sp.]|nr:DUF4189 domain-containing protein [Hydrogenophaga sp.]